MDASSRKPRSSTASSRTDTGFVSVRGAREHNLKNVSLDIGPTRHGITRGQTIYFFDPSGNRNEVFSGGYMYYPDMPTIEWTMDELGRAIFYPIRELNERFLTVMT